MFAISIYIVYYVTCYFLIYYFISSLNHITEEALVTLSVKLLFAIYKKETRRNKNKSHIVKF